MGDPSKVVAALELLATLTGIMVLDVAAGRPGPGQVRRGTAVLRGWTDSSVSAAVVAKGMTMSYPLCCVNMELAAQLEARGAKLELQWAPRTHNQETDDLTNERFEAFQGDLRVRADPHNLPMGRSPAVAGGGEGLL